MKSIYGILLAAGSSRRMGQPKQLLPWAGRPLVRHIAEVALASRLDGLVVVLGAESASVEAALAGLAGPFQSVYCADFATGQAASLRCGLAALPTQTAAALVLLVDQPLISSGLINHMLAVFADQPEALALIPRYHGQRGNPVILGAELFPALAPLQGDQGARAILAQHEARVHWLEVADPAVISDLDTPADYTRLCAGNALL